MLYLEYMRSVKKFTEFIDVSGLVHHMPDQCYGLFLCASFAEVAWCSSEEGTWQVGGTVVSESWSHGTTRNLFCSSPLMRKTFLSSHNHCTFRITLWMTFGYSLLWKWASEGNILEPQRTSKQMWWPDSELFQKKPSVSAFNNGRIDGASEWVHRGPALNVIK